MSATQTIRDCSALSHVSRLQITKMLVRRGPSGIVVREIADQLRLSVSGTLFHLRELLNAGLITERREGQKKFYSTNTIALERLFGFLQNNLYQVERKAIACKECEMPQVG